MYIGDSKIKVDNMFMLAYDQRTRGHTLKLLKHRSTLELHEYFSMVGSLHSYQSSQVYLKAHYSALFYSSYTLLTSQVTYDLKFIYLLMTVLCTGS